MKLSDLISQLRSLDIKLWVEGDRLRYKAPPGALTDELRAEVIKYKNKIIEFLQSDQNAECLDLSAIEVVPRDQTIPLSFAQQRLWFLHQLMPNSYHYTILRAFSFKGPLDIAALEQSLNKIVQRHEALRTYFENVKGQPVQRIHLKCKIKFVIEDLRELKPDKRRQTARQMANDEYLVPFDLSKGSLLRVKLLRLENDYHWFLLAMHHIISDGWSIGVFFHELALLYESYKKGRPSPLPELPVQYADFAVWQRQWLSGKMLTSQLSYWRQELSGELPILDLPTDYSRPAVQTFNGARQSIQLSKELSEALKKLSHRKQVTLFMTMLSAFKVLLHRYTDQEDIIVGSPTANRNRAEIEGLIGFFANMLVLRSRVSVMQSFLDLLTQVREATLGAYAHQDLPFEKLVNELGIDRDLSRSVLFQVVFALQNTPMEPLELVGLEPKPIEMDCQATHFELEVHVWERDGRLRVVFIYNRDLFAPSTIKRMMNHYRVLLEGIVSNPECHISELPMMSEAERREVLCDWNRTQTDYPRHASIQELFELQVERSSEATAVVYEDQRLTYGRLNERANQLARYLRSLGVGRGDLVAVCLERSIEMVVAMLGILKAGGAYVPLDVSYPAQRLWFMLEDSGPKVLLTREALLDRFSDKGLQVVCLDRDKDLIDKQIVSDLELDICGDDLAYVMYTSGSTGKPKGVEVMHRGVVRLVCKTDYVHLSAKDRMTHISNCSFDAATFEVWGALLSGARLVVLDQETVLSPQALADRLQEEQINVMFLTTSLFNLLARESPKVLAGVEHLLFGGEAANPHWVGQVLNENGIARLINLYGPTENTTVATWYEVSSVPEEAVTIPIGRPIANTRVYVLNSRMEPVPVGVAGELYVGGDGLARGYLNQPQLTEQSFVDDPFSEEAGSRLYRTGDLVRWREDGNIDFLGRSDAQIKLRGFRIELGEIESVLREHELVEEAVALLREDEPGEKHLVGYVVPRADVSLSVENLRAYLRQKLPEYMVPSYFVQLEAFPLTPNRKVDRRVLPAPDTYSMDLSSQFIEPRTPIEQALMEIWSEVLRRGGIGIHDNFFHLGGHSLLATQMISRVSKTFGLSLPVAELFEHPTVSEFASEVESRIRRKKFEQVPPIKAVERQPQMPLSFAQQRLWFISQLNPDSPVYNIPLAIELKGQLDKVALQKCINELIRRHESLRSRFDLRDGQPVQLVDVPQQINIPVIDLSELADSDRKKEAHRLVTEESLKPFDLTHGPLLRILLLRITEADHILLITLHHIVSDGWSLGVLFHELTVLYESYKKDQPSPLPELPIQYADFAVWQHNWLSGQVLEHQLDYWKRKLADYSILQLPIDKPRPVMQASNGGQKRIEWSESLTASLKELSRHEGVTLFMTLLSAFYVLLYRYSGQEEILVGSPIANRNRVEIEGLIGFFVNTLCLRGDLSGDPSFRSLLGRVREMILEAYEHQDLPFEKLVEELKPQRDLSRNPLFQIMFVLQNTPVYKFELSGLSISTIEVENLTAKTDLFLCLEEREGRLIGIMGYNTDIYEVETIRRMIDHFHNLLMGIVEDPNCPISKLTLLSKKEQIIILKDWNQTEGDYPEEVVVHQMLEEQTKRTPDHIAVVFEDKQLTYRELNEHANQLAHHLKTLGIGKDVLVGVCVERSIEMITGLMGILKAGGAYVPLDPAYPKERVAFMLDDTQAPVLLTQERLTENLPKHQAHVICLDTDWSKIARESKKNPVSEITPENLAYVIYTSGSTGKPKGVAIEHRNTAAFLAWAKKIFTFEEIIGVLASTSICFDLSVFEIFFPLSCGGKIILVENALSLLALPADQNVTLINTVPSAMSELVKVNGIPSSVRVVNLAGEALKNKLVQQIYQKETVRKVFNLYGPSEDTTYSTFALMKKGDKGSPSIGRPIANTKTYILDSHMQPVPIGVPGELYISGVGLARGYLNRPELTAEKFTQNPFIDEPGARMYRTGDLARYLKDGNIEFLGRLDHQVKIRGFRIELGEIESTLEKHPDVQMPIVIAREDNPGDKRLVAYIVKNQKNVPTPNELRNYLKKTLPEYMIPTAFVMMDALPLTPNGKVDQKSLPPPQREWQTEQTYITAKTNTQKKIADIWQEVLHLEKVGINDNFFDLGGHSLLLIQVRSKLVETLGYDLSVVDLFQYPTIESLARYISGDKEYELPSVHSITDRHPAIITTSKELAIIGLAGHFPDAKDVEQFWVNIRDGIESIRFFSNEELLESGIDPKLLRDPSYVKASGYYVGVEMFDAHFFGYTPREAELIDPQQRLFLECSWEALESAGYAPSSNGLCIGVYAGSSMNLYNMNLRSNPKLLKAVGGLQALISGDKDFLATRVSYKLNLCGPSVNVQTACSTSLVAVHEACKSLLNNECDIALAGGVRVSVPMKSGYLYHENGIMSPDGHCRTFDANACGTVHGNGVGVVVLKRLDEALSDGDFIYAVIKGSAINNDGSLKVGYTAPSVEGQTQAIRSALTVAGVDPRTIGYIETHGTGTSLGDPIEVAALKRAFGEISDKGFCALGSVKTNIGHLDAAAGVAGLIKATMALRHKELPPSLHFHAPNPQIDFNSSPFYVNTSLRPWPLKQSPRRAGVSSFGIGGTNAHVILEEAPEQPPSGQSRPCHLLMLSAKSPSALETATSNLADYLRHNDGNLADVAYTLQVGRQDFAYRCVIVCHKWNEALEALEGRAPHRVFHGKVETGDRPVMFLFSGQGSQYPNMGLDLYLHETVFRTELERCSRLVQELLGFDLLQMIYPPDGHQSQAAEQLKQTLVTQPALFCLEYALAKLWMSWGVQPNGMLGHSIGEYVAACLSGVFGLEDALGLVCERGRLMSNLPAGSMLAVEMSEKELSEYIQEPLSIAVINGPRLCVVSAPEQAVAALESKLIKKGLTPRRLHTSHAFHSQMMDPIIGPFTDKVRCLSLDKPKIPYISNVTGQWITNEDVKDQSYWARQLREAVRFSEGLSQSLAKPGIVLLEVGPGKTLCSLAQRHPDSPSAELILSSLRHPKVSVSDETFLLEGLARLWLSGVKIDWSGFYCNERRHRVPLPTYPFERQRYWIDSKVDSFEPQRDVLVKAKMSDWFYVPSWKRVPWPVISPSTASRWLLFLDECGLGDSMARRLKEQGCEVICVKAGQAFKREAAGIYCISPDSREDYKRLLKEFGDNGLIPNRIVHMWTVSEEKEVEWNEKHLNLYQQLGFYSLLYLVQALGETELNNHVVLTIVSSNLHNVYGQEFLCPEKSLILGMCLGINQEYQQISCTSVDVEIPSSCLWDQKVLDRLLLECKGVGNEPVVAYREQYRWVQSYEPLLLDGLKKPPDQLREDGVYLIIGGLGGIGLELAGYFARTVHARLVLVSRKELPHREEWDNWLSAHDSHDLISRRIKKIRSLEAVGAEVIMFSAEVEDEARMQAIIEEVLSRWGRIDGVIHSAGIGIHGGEIIQLKEPEVARQVLSSKVIGMRVLERVLSGLDLDFMVLCSSLASILYGVGQVDYCAANVFLDAFARYLTSTGKARTISINWNIWKEAGMGVDIVMPEDMKSGRDDRLQKLGISNEEGVEIFSRILGKCTDPQVAVSREDLNGMLEHMELTESKDSYVPEYKHDKQKELVSFSSHPRPHLSTEYIEPRNEIERIIADIWQRQLGIDRVGIYDNFFELGGDSLIAVQVIVKVSEANLKLTPAQIFNHPSIAELASQLNPNRVTIGKKPNKDFFTPCQQTEHQEVPKMDRCKTSDFSARTLNQKDLDIITKKIMKNGGHNSNAEEKD